ncbi:unnamed protein product [Allacma fusca]|uniref:Uncharacterized protein n=1 Tax=Allacma fusca TaxID=39272 RepID=A0A8J2KLQ2_9HEXA|nr:unnamed protein product [Allacma fusca]
MPGKGFGLLVKAPKGSSKSRSTNTSSGSKSKKTDKGKNNVRFRPKEDNYVPINTGMDSVAEADRSVTDSTTVQTADGDGVIRIKVRSKQLMEVFRPIRLFLNIFARFPFAIHFRIDGTIYFTYMTCFQSFNALMFTLGSIISVAIFLYILCGFVGAFIGWGSKSKERELCKLTWEERGMRQAMVPLIIFFCWSASFAIGSLYSIRYGKRFEFYYNYWNRAVQVMNMDAT